MRHLELKKKISFDWDVITYTLETPYGEFVKYHRHDGPAYEMMGGLREWYKNGKLHRSDGFAVEYSPKDYNQGYGYYYLFGSRLLGQLVPLLIFLRRRK